MARSRKKKIRKTGTGMSTFTVGLIAIIIVVVGTYLGFTKHIPFTHGFRVKAVFTSANSIRLNSPVRIAGVNVGKVKSVSRYKDSKDSVITMEIQPSGLPIHTDATLQIRPRIFLEGNFFVDLKPGTPEAATIKDNGTIPVTQTSTPVQLDQVLTALQSDTRSDLQVVLDQYGIALSKKPTAAQDRGQDPAVVGLTGAQALQKSLRFAPSALKNSAIVNEATLGTRPHDLSGVVASLAKVSTALSSRELQLKDLITHFNQTMAATASQADNLRASLRLLPPTLTVAFRTLGDLDASLPAVRGFARDILPGTLETAATINASFPWIKQTKALLGPSELQGVARELRKTSPSLGTLIDGTVRLLPQVDLVDRCVTNVVLPSGDVKINADGPSNYSGKANYKEFWYTMVGLASEGQNFDGNGSYVHFQTGGGLNSLSTGKAQISGETLVGNDPKTPSGTAPAYPTKPNGQPNIPAFRPTFDCYKNKPLTSAILNGPAAHGAGDRSQPNNPGGTPIPTLPGLPALPPIPLPTVPGIVLPPLPTLRTSSHGAAARTAPRTAPSAKASKPSSPSKPAKASTSSKETASALHTTSGSVASDIVSAVSPFRKGSAR